MCHYTNKNYNLKCLFLKLLLSCYCYQYNFYICLNLLQTKPGLLHLWVPLSVAGIFAYFVAHCFISVYEVSFTNYFLYCCTDTFN